MRPLGLLAVTCLLAMLVSGLIAVHVPRGVHAELSFTGTSNATEVSIALDLHDPVLHPSQLVYDGQRDGLWFWTSTQRKDTGSDNVVPDNQIYFFDIAKRQLRSWPIYSGDWSSQLLAGLALDTSGNVWLGWNHHLIRFMPGDGKYQRFEMPAAAKYPLSSAVLGDLPADLGIADLAAAPNGAVWIARYGALSLTSFDPASGAFMEHPLPASGGDPAKLTMMPDGHIVFTTNLSADHPGYCYEKVGEYDPQTGGVTISARPARALAVAPNGDLYTTLGGPGFGLARASANERATAWAQRRAPIFEDGLVPFDADGIALAADTQGRVWLAMAGQPYIALLDTSTGQIHQYRYAAPSIAANPPHFPGFEPPISASPGAVWVSHIMAMATDGQGHLWYVRAGSDSVEEVSA